MCYRTLIWKRKKGIIGDLLIKFVEDGSSIEGFISQHIVIISKLFYITSTLVMIKT